MPTTGPFWPVYKDRFAEAVYWYQFVGNNTSLSMIDGPGSFFSALKRIESRFQPYTFDITNLFKFSQQQSTKLVGFHT